MSSGSSEVSGNETIVHLPPPEKKQSPVSDGSDGVLECAYPSDVSDSDSDSDSEADREADCESDCECANDERALAYFAREEFVKYFESVRKSRGFDVTPLPKGLAVGSIVPLYSDDKNAPPLSYLKKHLEFVKVRKTMSQPSGGSRYYITFDTKDAGITKTYQSVVFYGITKIKVQSFRLNPTDDAQGSSDNWLCEGHIYKGKRSKRVM